MQYPVSLSRQLREHLRGLRVQNGLTQSELGKRLGLGQARIAEIESKPGAISVDQLLQILSALGAGMLVDDGKGAAQVVHPDSPEKPVAGKTASPSSSTGKSSARKLQSGATPVSRSDGAAGTQQDLRELQAANPAADVTPTSRRNFVIRSRKGSW